VAESCENGIELWGFIKSAEIFACLKSFIMRFFDVRLMELMAKFGQILLASI
jgi:hypothetical protein